MKQNRRNILTMMGLASASVAMGTDAIAEDLGPPAPHLGRPHKGVQDKFAEALENMARAIRNKEMVVTKLSIDSVMDFKDPEWLSHNVTLNCEILKDHTS